MREEKTPLPPFCMPLAGVPVGVGVAMSLQYFNIHVFVLLLRHPLPFPWYPSWPNLVQDVFEREGAGPP